MVDYPGDAVLHGERAVGYLTAALRAGVWATRQHINDDDYVGIIGHEVPVEMDAPMEEARYPYIHVMYRARGFEPLSLGDWSASSLFKEGDEDEWDDFCVYRFDGTYLVNIYATTILERETLADCCIGAFGIDDRYRDLFYSNPYINIAPNMYTLSSPTSNESWGTPWDKDAMTAFRQLSFDVLGEFYYRVRHKAEYLSVIELEGILGEGVRIHGRVE